MAQVLEYERETRRNGGYSCPAILTYRLMRLAKWRSRRAAPQSGVERKRMAGSAEQIAQHLADHPGFGPYVSRVDYPHGYWLYPSGQPMQMAAELSEEMVEDVGFRALQLGGFLKTPDGELIAEGVGLALPNADRELFDLAVKTCFYVTPMGEEGSEQRMHADLLLG